MSSFDTTQYSTWATQAMTSYLENNTNLNDSISKIASENGLTPTQIGRVCQEANVSTYQELFKSAKDKTFNFPVADSKAIVGALGEAEANGSPVPLDYLLSPPQQKIAHDWKGLLGVESIGNESKISEKIAQLEATRENIKMARSEIELRLSDNRLRQENTRHDLADKMKQHILQETDKVASYKQIVLAVKTADLPEDEVIKAAEYLLSEGVFGEGQKLKGLPGLEKAGEAVQADLISTTQFTGSPAPIDRVKIVNGNHPIIVTVNQLVDQVSEEDRLKQGLMMLDDKAGYSIQKIEDLNTSVSTDRYVQKETAVPVVRNRANPDPWLRRMRSGIIK